jgi:hypothetical protein
LLPGALARFSETHLDHGIAILIPLDLPFKPQANQGGTLDDELAGGDGVGGVERKTNQQGKD